MINDGLTVYFGSKQTHLFFRFYEKDYERASQEMTSVEAIREMYGLLKSLWNFHAEKKYQPTL